MTPITRERAIPADDLVARRDRDAALARRACSGDREAQTTLFREHVDRVHHVLHRLLGGRDVEDATQETFLRLYTSLPRYRGDALLSTWASRIAVHVAQETLRRRKRTPTPIEPDEVEAPAIDVDGTLHDADVSRRLYAVLDRLDPRMRIAFVLHEVEGLSMAEVADAMNATRVATKTRVWRARRELERRARHDRVLAALLDEKEASDVPHR